MPWNVHLRAANGQYVCAEGGGGRELSANRNVAREWETFVLIVPDGPPLRHGSRVVLKSYEGYYVCAENGGGGEVSVTRNLPSTWETFTIIHADESDGEITNGQQVALRASNGQYVCAEGSGGNGVVANRPSHAAWEHFTLEILGDAHLRGHQGPTQLASGEWMESWVTLSNTGDVQTETHIWTTNKFYGFTGGTVMLFLDIDEQVIGSIPMPSYGVDGTWIPTNLSSRDKIKPDHVGVDIYNKTTKIWVGHKLTPNDAFIVGLNQVVQEGKAIWDAIQHFLQGVQGGGEGGAGGGTLPPDDVPAPEPGL